MCNQAQQATDFQQSSYSGYAVNLPAADRDGGVGHSLVVITFNPFSIYIMVWSKSSES